MCLTISNNLLLVLQDAPKRIFSTNSRSCAQPKNDAKTLFPTIHRGCYSTVFFSTATVLAFVLLRDSRFNFHCHTQREATPTRKSARKCAATSRDFLRERLQSAFTLANRVSLNHPIDMGSFLMNQVMLTKRPRSEARLGYGQTWGHF